MSFGDNKLSNPFEIVEAREAQHKASEMQRNLADELANAHRDLADAERRYRVALTARIKQLHANGFGDGHGLAITMCETVAKGEDSIATLRYERDDKAGEVAKLEQLAFAMGADRRGLDGLIDWSKHRDLRVDTPPADWMRREMEPAVPG